LFQCLLTGISVFVNGSQVFANLLTGVKCLLTSVINPKP
jgi:hypothetical protein